MLFFVNIQFVAHLPRQPETGDEAVDRQILGDLVFAVNDLQHQFSLWLLQLFAERYSKTAPQEIRIYYRDIGIVDDIPETMDISEFYEDWPDDVA